MNWSTNYGDPVGAGGGTEIRATGLTDVDETGTSYEVGKGRYKIVIVVSAIEIASNDENYNIDIEANTRAATSTYKTIGGLSLGPTEMTGRSSDDTIGTYVILIDNPNDHQIRTHVRLVGSVATGINFVATVYPLDGKR